jgi:hypothetical protein
LRLVIFKALIAIGYIQTAFLPDADVDCHFGCLTQLAQEFQ